MALLLSFRLRRKQAMRVFRIENNFLRWAAYGYALAFLGWLGLLAILAAHDGGTGYSLRKCGYGLIWAIPWAIAAGLCGLASKVTGPKVAAAAAVAGVIGGVAYDFSESGTVDGWLAMTVPFYAIPAMLGGVAITAVLCASLRLRRG